MVTLVSVALQVAHAKGDKPTDRTSSPAPSLDPHGLCDAVAWPACVQSHGRLNPTLMYLKRRAEKGSTAMCLPTFKSHYLGIGVGHF